MSFQKAPNDRIPRRRNSSPHKVRILSLLHFGNFNFEVIFLNLTPGTTMQQICWDNDKPNQKMTGFPSVLNYINTLLNDKKNFKLFINIFEDENLVEIHELSIDRTIKTTSINNNEQDLVEIGVEIFIHEIALRLRRYQPLHEDSLKYSYSLESEVFIPSWLDQLGKRHQLSVLQQTKTSRLITRQSSQVSDALLGLYKQIELPSERNPTKTPRPLIGRLPSLRSVLSRMVRSKRMIPMKGMIQNNQVVYTRENHPMIPTILSRK